MGQTGKWVMAATMTVVVFVVTLWASATFLLPSVMRSQPDRLAVASGIATAIASVIAAVIPAGLSLQQARRTQLQAQDAVENALDPHETLDERLDQLSASLAQSARLVEKITAELDAQASTARRLQREAADAEAIAAVHKDQTEAVRRLLRSEITTELARTQRHIFRDSVKIAIGSFVLGGALTLVVTLLVHPLG
jgi:uncharacterized membrane-anchored protein YhcB (DUF1043 family)